MPDALLHEKTKVCSCAMQSVLHGGCIHSGTNTVEGTPGVQLSAQHQQWTRSNQRQRDGCIETTWPRVRQTWRETVPHCLLVITKHIGGVTPSEQRKSLGSAAVCGTAGDMSCLATAKQHVMTNRHRHKRKQTCCTTLFNTASTTVVSSLQWRSSDAASNTGRMVFTRGSQRC